MITDYRAQQVLVDHGAMSYFAIMLFLTRRVSEARAQWHSV